MLATLSASNSTYPCSPLAIGNISVPSRPRTMVAVRYPSDADRRNCGLLSAGPVSPSPLGPWQPMQTPA